MTDFTINSVHSDWKIDPALSIAGGRLTVFALPKAGEVYSLGLDFAQGIEGGDFDAGVMLDQFGEQVLTVHGHWGASFDQVLMPIVRAYQPFVVGERQATGLTVLRSLLEAGAWLYFNRDETKRGRPTRDSLGHFKSYGDQTIPRLQRAIGKLDYQGQSRPPAIIIHDAELHTELCHFRYQSTSTRVPIEEADNSHTTMGAPPGEHDDLVHGCAYAVMGLMELPKFPKPALPVYPVGTYGHLFKHNEVLFPPPKPPGQLARSGRRD